MHISDIKSIQDISDKFEYFLSNFKSIEHPRMKEEDIVNMKTALSNIEHILKSYLSSGCDKPDIYVLEVGDGQLSIMKSLTEVMLQYRN